MFHVPIHFKNPHPFGVESSGNNGYFLIPHRRIANYYFVVMASDGMGWEHVSISLAQRPTPRQRKLSAVHRCPTWEEMCYVKDIFWDNTDCVVQYHPPKSDHISNHPYCLHLWRPTDEQLPAPPSFLVGLKAFVNE